MKLTKEEMEEVRKKALKLIAAGKVEFANPKAAGISLRGEKAKDFEYCDAKLEVIEGKPFLTIQWGMQGFGFGEILLYNDGSTLKIMTEHMSKGFVAKVFKKLLSDLVDHEGKAM